MNKRDVLLEIKHMMQDGSEDCISFIEWLYLFIEEQLDEEGGAE